MLGEARPGFWEPGVNFHCPEKGMLVKRLVRADIGRKTRQSKLLKYDLTWSCIASYRNVRHEVVVLPVPRLGCPVSA